jgi:hypothetical protein
MTDTTALAAFRKWGQALKDEGNSLGDTLLSYAEDWARDLAATTAAQPVAQYEVREDGKTVRVDRWEIGIRRIVALLWGNYREFEVNDVVEAVRMLIPEPFNDGDDEEMVRSVLAAASPAEPTQRPLTKSEES